MKLLVKKAKTSKTLVIFVQDSSSTTGAGLTGLAWNTASLSWYYYREGQGTGATQVTLATMTIGTWATGGFVEIDATDMPGWYELGVPNAVLATGVDFVGMQLKGAANMAPVNIEIQLTDLDLNDSVRAGLTSLPNAAADAAGGLPISDTGGLDLDAMNQNITDIETDTADMQPKIGTPAVDLAADIAAVKVDSAAILIDTGDMQPKLGSPAADISADIAAIKAETALIVADTNELQTDNIPGLIAALNDPTAAAIADAVWDELQSAHVGAGSFGEMATELAAILVDTADMQPKIGSPAADLAADIAAVKVDTAAVLVDTADMQPKLGTPAADISADIAAVKVVDDAIKVVTDKFAFTVANQVDANVLTNSDKTGYGIVNGGIAAATFAAGAIDAAALAQDAAQEVADEVLNRDLAGGGSGNTRNVRNALRALRNKVAIAAGTLTVSQEDDVTPAWTGAVTRDATADPIVTVDPV